MVSSLVIRPVVPEDASVICSLVQELADFEKMPDGPRVTAEQTAEYIKNKAFQGFLAFDGETPAGMLLFYYAYSTWKGPFVHMEDLYVRPQYRCQRVGLRLWSELGKFGVANKIPRIEWDVLDWNVNAIKFYEKMEATNMNKAEGWLKYRLTEEGIDRLAHYLDNKQ
uniref:N-acetyltransferase domain-containing protein n=1 Tax=Steinernema glaseri TaxID=37863 RepID=A0A1I7YNX7_9BILA